MLRTLIKETNKNYIENTTFYTFKTLLDKFQDIYTIILFAYLT